MSQKNQFVEWKGSMDVNGSSIDGTTDANKEHLFLGALKQILKRFKYTSAEALCRYSTVRCNRSLLPHIYHLLRWCLSVISCLTRSHLGDLHLFWQEHTHWHTGNCVAWSLSGHGTFLDARGVKSGLVLSEALAGRRSTRQWRSDVSGGEGGVISNPHFS